METQTKYEKIKNTAKKYVGIAFLAGALTIPYLAKAETLPIDAETRAELAPQEQVYSNNLVKARNAFNLGVKDRKFTVDEQREVKKYLDEAQKIHENLPDTYKNLYSGIDKNLNGWIWENSNLQNELKEEGLEVKVESRDPLHLGFCLGWGISAFVTGLIRGALKKKNN